MAKKEKKVPETKPDTGLWANIIKASVKGNPRPRRKEDVSTTNFSEVTERIELEVAKVARDCRKYLLYQVGDNRLYYSINYSCPVDKANQIEQVMLEIATQFELSVTSGRMAE